MLTAAVPNRRPGDRVFAEIALNLDAVLWLGVPPVASIAVLVAGVLLRKRAPRTASFLATVGIIGVIVSAGWIVLAFYVDSVERHVM